MCSVNKLNAGWRLGVLNRNERLRNLKTVEDVSYCHSCEHCDCDFQGLSLQFRATLHGHFKHTRGVQLLRADV